MEIGEPIESINNQLRDLFGVDTITGEPIWRVVWSNDQYEKRLVECTPRGIQLIHPQVMEVPKYSNIRDKFVLERLVLVPEFQQNELAGKKISYEPMFPFQDKKGNYLPPRVDVAKFVIDTVYAAQGKGSLRHYLEDPATPENKAKRLKEMEDYLSADETDISDALSGREGVALPSRHFGESDEPTVH